MAEQASVDQSLEKILHLICNGEMEENLELNDHSIPFESLIPSKILIPSIFWLTTVIK